MFKNQSMESRLKVAFGFMGVLILIMAIVGWTSSEQLGSHIRTLSINTIPSVNGLWKINEGQTQIESSERGLLGANLNVEQRRAEITRIDNAWKQIDEGFKEYESAPSLPGEAELYADFQAKWTAWENLHKKFLQLNAEFESRGVLAPARREVEILRQGQTNNAELQGLRQAQEAFQQLETQADENRDEFQAATDGLLKLIALNQSAAQEVIEESSQDVSQSRFWALVGIFLGPVTALIFGTFFSNTIAKPLGTRIAGVVAAAQKISEGDLRATVERSEQGDELGQLQNAFCTMQKDLNNLIERIQNAGQSINYSAQQINAAGQELQTTVSQQAASIQEVAVTSHQIANTSEDLVSTMDEVKNLSQNTAQAAGESQSNLQQMETTMRQLVEDTKSITLKLSMMNEKANNINRVITTITKVADQTNLLSLNAAIEAEKAGEYGAGFAVVAREIRRLADQTAVATLEIEQMVKEMQTAVSGGVMEMDKFNQSVSHSVDNVTHISDQVALVIKQIQELTPRFVDVSHSVQEQSLGAQQISQAMDHLNQASNNTLNMVQSTNSALHTLESASNGLRSEISRFQVERRQGYEDHGNYGL
ncbi:MAG: HAMP domain-containing methyl-accepting chemotaxis protein [Prochlorotrichaceae cyanobacterium]|jgi:methyl-accepting chemotaxis protein WspA